MGHHGAVDDDNKHFNYFVMWFSPSLRFKAQKSCKFALAPLRLLLLEFASVYSILRNVVDFAASVESVE